jgi:hypothetical protein
MFVLDPDPYLLPSYGISPFSTSDIAFNNNLPVDDLIDEYFKDRFLGHEYFYTLSGRAAINNALSYYHLQKDDTVAILTTSGNSYISSCVTTEIEKFCKWSRQIDSDTRLIFVNHEFGFPCTRLSELKKKGLPIIEDCAHSFFSKDKDDIIGNIGDFVIYSFPKMFPLQIGGLLKSNLSGELHGQKQIGYEILRYIKNVLSHYIGFQEKIIKSRIDNYNIVKDKFDALGFSEWFQLEDGIVPGVFMFRTERHEINLIDLKKYFWAHGVQCSVFYGEKAFFIPVHQALTEQDLSYFYEVMKSFIQKTMK